MLVTVLLPLLLVVAAVVDLAFWLRSRKAWVGVRLAAFLWWFLFCEMQALAAMLWIWLRSGGPWGLGSDRRRIGIYNLRAYWAATHLAGIRVLFGLNFEVEGLEVAAPGPVLIFIRHASIVDNLLPDTLIARTHGVGLRYVIKRELQVIPTIDIGGRWVSTTYVRRDSGNAAAETARLKTLAHDLGPGEGILIYPEGTRCTQKKLARAKEKIAESQPQISPLANELHNLLPPRLGGPLALIEEAADLDVVFCGHVGFDDFESIGEIWRGGLVGSTIRVTLWRCPAAEIPTGERERTEWLYANWQRMDDWIGEHREAPPPVE